MLERCSNPNARDFGRYGGRGILVCDRWRLSFDAFADDMGDHPGDGYSIDRINNEAGYSPENCRWATATQQARNKRTTIMIDGEHVVVVAERIGVRPETLRKRVRKGTVRSALYGGDLRKLPLTTCRAGHDRTGANVYTSPDGRTQCRQCIRAAQHHRQSEKRSSF